MGKKFKLLKIIPLKVIVEKMEQCGLEIQEHRDYFSSEDIPFICKKHKEKGIQYITYKALQGRESNTFVNIVTMNLEILKMKSLKFQKRQKSVWLQKK